MHLGKVTTAFQKIIGRARGEPAPPGYLSERVFIKQGVEQTAGPFYNFGDFFVGVKFKPEDSAGKSGTERGRDPCHSSGSCNKGERRQIKLESASRRALPDDNV